MFKPRALTGLCAAIVLGGDLAACQSYDMQPVVPAAPFVKVQPVVPLKRDPAKVMLARDKSGSMQYTPENESTSCCESVDSTGLCVGYRPTGSCKLNSLKSKLLGSNGFIDKTRSKVRLGLAIFPKVPSDNTLRIACDAGAIYVPVADRPDVTTDDIRTALDKVQPGGGTPSAQLLREIAANEAFAKEEPSTPRFVILITDGMPNCNAKITQCEVCTNRGGLPSQQCGGAEQCLDDANLVAAVKELHDHGIDTFVVGFGKDTGSSVAARVLAAAADAGGQAQRNAATAYYQADGEGDLQAVLDAIIPVIADPCTFALEPPVAKLGLLEVSVADATLGTEEKLVRGQDWHFATNSHETCCDSSTCDDSRCPGSFCWPETGTYHGQCVTKPQKVTLDGKWCETIQAATDPGRYTVELYGVGSL